MAKVINFQFVVKYFGYTKNPHDGKIIFAYLLKHQIHAYGILCEVIDYIR